jgi:hypothetical protein
LTRRSGFSFNGSGIDFRNNFPANPEARNQEMADPTTYQFNLSSTERPTEFQFPKLGIQESAITGQYAQLNEMYIPLMALKQL